MRKTKIICTIGPASNSEEMIQGLIEKGMDVARLNFSHGAPDQHVQTISTLRRCAEKLGVPLAILQDLQGPKIRIGSLEDGGKVHLEPGAEVIITTRDIVGNAGVVSTTYQDLPRDVNQGDCILLADGQIELEVLSITSTDVRCRVVHGGELREHQGINLPNVSSGSPALTDKDKDDLMLGLKHGVDYIAQSFVRTAQDVREVKGFISEHGSETPVIAKLETYQALEHLEEILSVADGVMIARGDLGVVLPLERVPTWQKRIIAEANKGHVLVITATQMMESMIHSPRPTRAEANDVANAVFDGTDAVMLSGETAIGAYPLEAVEVMGRIVLEADSVAERPQSLSEITISDDFPSSISYAARRIVRVNPSVCAIVAFTISGFTAHLVSKIRPKVPILALTPNPQVYNALSLLWGVVPRSCPYFDDMEDMVGAADAILQAEGLGAPGQSAVILGSLPLRSRGITNFLRLHRIGAPN
ncbi:MAG: pyruvate kinase [Chloroflexi bacterium]|nr:pyruvate kinase [Chloroflexota bacterium]